MNFHSRRFPIAASNLHVLSSLPCLHHIHPNFPTPSSPPPPPPPPTLQFSGCTGHLLLHPSPSRPSSTLSAIMRRAATIGLGIFRSQALSSEERLISASSRSRYQWINRLSTDSSSTGDHKSSVDVDFIGEESKRRLCNRLLYRSRQRGFLELDLVLGKWVEENVYSMDVDGIKSLINVLDLENPDLWKWLSGQEQPPEAVKVNPVFTAIHEKVMNNLSTYSAPETRAIPGQQWVRGWDDIKKGRDGPIAGNQ